jgi:hypothetical protein
MHPSKRCYNNLHYSVPCGLDNGSGPEGLPNPNRSPSGMPDPAVPNTSNPYNLPPSGPGNFGPDLN